MRFLSETEMQQASGGWFMPGIAPWPGPWPNPPIYVPPPDSPVHTPSGPPVPLPYPGLPPMPVPLLGF